MSASSSRAAYQARRYDETEFELRINEIQLMSDEVFDKMIKHICLEVSNEELNESLLKRIHDLCTQYEGSKPLQFQISDPEYNAQIPLICNGYPCSAYRGVYRGVGGIGRGVESGVR